MVPSNGGKRYKFIRQIGLYTTIPAIMVTGPTLGYLIGSYLDSYFGTEPWLLAIMVFVGMGASVKELIDVIKKAERDNGNNK